MIVFQAISIALLATLGQWWFFGPVTMTLVNPLTSGTLVGIIMGDPMTGMLAGANIQLIYLGYISAGGTMPSNTITAGIYGSVLTILSGADPAIAATFAIPFSMIGLLQNQVYMTSNTVWIHKADKYLEKGNIRGVRLMNFLPSFCTAFILYGIPGFAIVYFGNGWAESLINAVPDSVINALQVVGGIMPALGIAMLLNYLGKKNLIPWFFAGFFVTEYLNLDLTAISIFAAIIAILLFVNDKSKAETKENGGKRVRRLSVSGKTTTEQNVEEPTIDTSTTRIKLSKATLIKTWLMSSCSEACYNYERLQALGIANTMITPIMQLYKDDERRAEELKKYMVFYNSDVFTLGPIINGITCSMEEARANGDNVTPEDVNSVRTGLMGPVAGIGDTLRQGILFPILYGLGCSIALDGSFIGPILTFILYEGLVFTVGYFMFMTGYSKGKTALMNVLKNGLIDRIINAFSIVGLMVVGAMAATRVAISTSLVYHTGSNGALELQTVLDSLAPGLIPLGITLLMSKLLKKKMNILAIIVIIFIIGVIGYYTGILSYVK